MKILFVYSGNRSKSSPIVLNQAQSMIASNIDLGYYSINKKGIWGYFKHVLLLRKFLHINKFNIIHAHYGLCGIVALFARRDEKVIVSFMGDDLLGSSGAEGRLTLGSKLLAKINGFLSYRFYDYSIVKSEQMFHVLKKSTNVSICSNGVSLDGFLPIDKSLAIKRTGFSGNDINLIFVSDPVRHEKNYTLALSAIGILNDSTHRLHIIKNVNPKELKYYYSAADILIMTSLHEGSPNVIKEAMACNCPIVSTDVGDVRAVIGDTEGCYISSFDPVDVSQKIKLAIEFRQKYKQTRGRERIIELGLDSENVAKRIVGIYEKII